MSIAKHKLRPVVVADGIGYVSINKNASKTALIDSEDVDKVSLYNWYYDGTHGYISCTQKTVGDIRYLHHLIMGKPPTGMVIDHINKNKLDNRKTNLRFATKRQNGLNANLSKRNPSGHVGVVWRKREKRWSAGISIGGINKHLGYFNDIKEAIKVREEAVLAYFKVKGNL